MSKGKKGSKATPEAVSWDEGLLNTAVEEVCSQLQVNLLATYLLLLEVSLLLYPFIKKQCIYCKAYEM